MYWNVPASCPSEIANAQVLVTGEQKVIRFDVPVQDTYPVHVTQAGEELRCKVSQLCLLDAAAWLLHRIAPKVSSVAKLCA